jgi:hypothetical protein
VNLALAREQALTEDSFGLRERAPLRERPLLADEDALDVIRVDEQILDVEAESETRDVAVPLRQRRQ